MMRIEKQLPLVEEILGQWKETIGADFAGYRNHVYRMINFCFAVGAPGDEARQKIVIAGCFHDLGIWPQGTLNYLPPSIDRAAEYLARHGLNDWSKEIELMIGQHHKVRKYTNTEHSLVEVFRQGDLVDFSLGLVKCRVPPPYVRAVKAEFPNAGFHRQLVRNAGRWICRHPLNPVPVLKW
jgi:hypothetical protein